MTPWRLPRICAVTLKIVEYADIRWQLERIGKRIDHFDLLIAATALHEDLIVVTGNIDHFNRIPDLKTENWMI